MKALLAAGFPAIYIFRPAYIYLVQPAEGTEFQRPPVARDLSRVSGLVPQPSDSGRRLGPSHGACCRRRNRRAPDPGFGEP